MPEEGGNTAGERGLILIMELVILRKMLKKEREGCLRKRQAHVFWDLGDLVYPVHLEREDVDSSEIFCEGVR